MLKFFVSALLIISTLAHADTDKTKIREIKIWANSISLEATCIDEYLTNRNHLEIKMGLTPVIITSAVAAGIFSGAFIGVKLFLLSGAENVGFADLGAMVGGGFLGALSGLGISGTTSTLNVINFFRNQNLLRLIYESRHNGGLAVDKFFSKFIEGHPASSIKKDQFMSLIEELDLRGALCNGSIVARNRYKHGRKLTQRLANGEEIFNALAQ